MRVSIALQLKKNCLSARFSTGFCNRRLRNILFAENLIFLDSPGAGLQPRPRNLKRRRKEQLTRKTGNEGKCGYSGHECLFSPYARRGASHSSCECRKTGFALRPGAGQSPPFDYSIIRLFDYFPPPPLSRPDHGAGEFSLGSRRVWRHHVGGRHDQLGRRRPDLEVDQPRDTRRAHSARLRQGLDPGGRRRRRGRR